MKPIENKVALITGAGQGIGCAIALRLASDGANIAVAYKSTFCSETTNPLSTL